MTTVENLIKEYETNKNLSSHIKTDYINYENKINICKRIVRATTTRKVNGSEVFCIDTPAQIFQFNLQLINEYTDIYMGAEPAKQLENFNLLNKNRMIQPIMEAIPKSEYQEFRGILDMCVRDYMENYRSLTSLLETKLGAIQAMIGTFGDSFGEVVKAAMESQEGEEIVG